MVMVFGGLCKTVILILCCDMLFDQLLCDVRGGGLKQTKYR